MSNYNMSDCLTVGLVLLFLIGALIAGPSLETPPIPEEKLLYLQEKMLKERKEGVIEQFSEPGKALGQVNPDMLRLYNS